MNILVNRSVHLFDKHEPWRTFTFRRKPSAWLTDNVEFLMLLHTNAKYKFKRTKM